MFKRNALLFSLVLFSLGLFLTINDVELCVVSFLNHLLNLHLDIVFRSQGLFYCGGLLITLSVMTGLFFLSDKRSISRRLFFLFSSSALIIFYFFFLWKDATNAPITDDYKILIFLDQYIHKTALAEKWQLLIQPINECKVIVPKLYYLAVLKIFGGVNFKWLIMVNGFILLAICHILFKPFHYHSSGIFQLSFLFLMLQFQSFDLAYWATAGVCHYLVFLFAMLSIRTIINCRPYCFSIALLFALLASFSFGNGLLVFPIGCLMFLFQGRIKQAINFAIAMIAIVAIYFYLLPNNKAFWEFNLPAIFIYACGFLGSCFQFMYSLYIPVLAGFLCISIFIYATIKKYYKNNPFLWSMLLFIIMAAFITAPFRLQWSPLEPRYGLYSVAALTICLMIIAEMHISLLPTPNFQLSSLSRLILVAAICYNLLTGIMFYPEAPVRKIKLQHLVNDWENGRPLTYYFPVVPYEAEKYLDEAKKSGIWKEE